MDGSSRQVLHSTSLSRPYALTLDYDNQTLYWADYNFRRIEKSNLDGTERSILTTSNVFYPIDITYHDGRLFWIDQTYRRVYTTSVSSPTSVTSLNTNLGSTPYSIQVVFSTRQPEGNNDHPFLFVKIDHIFLCNMSHTINFINLNPI